MICSSIRGMICGLGIALAVSSTASAQMEVPASVLKEEQSRIEIIAHAVRSFVAVYSRDGQQGGSGLIISSDGLAVTNFHVIQPCGIEVICGLANGKSYSGVVIGGDPVGDLALIQILDKGPFQPATFRDSDEVKVGEACFAAGNPFLLADDFQPSVSWGTVSGMNRYQYPSGTLLEYTDCLQTDAAINPGNSGGPLFDAQGRCIGINGRGSFEKRGRVNVGVGFAISSNQVRRYLGALQSGRILDHASPGFTVTRTDNQTVVVTKILQSSDAYRQGIRFGDEIIEVAGRRIQSTNDLQNMIGTIPPFWRIPVKINRVENGTRSEMWKLIKLKPLHSPGELQDQVEFQVNRENLDFAGDHFESRIGYVNYHFNQRKVSQILEKLQWPESFTGNKDRFQLLGSSRLDPFRLIFGKSGTGLKVGNVTFAVSAESDRRLQPRTSGFMNLLDVWAQIHRPKSGLAVQYIGTAPFWEFKGEITNFNSRKLYDVIQIRERESVIQFYVDPQGHIAAGELMGADSDLGAIGSTVEFRKPIRHSTSPPMASQILILQNGRPLFDLKISNVEIPQAETSDKEDQ